MAKFVKSRLGKKGIKKRIQKQNAKKRARALAEETLSSASDKPRAVEEAIKYLSQWTDHHSGSQNGWKFNKTRQVFLLKAWPDRNRLPADAFKQLLVYMTSLPGNLRSRTVEQARQEASSAEQAEKEVEAELAALCAGLREDAAEDVSDELEERRDVLKIRRVRALRVIETLTSNE